MKVVETSKVHTPSITLSKPKKKHDRYISHISYEGEPLLLRTGKFQITHSSSKYICFQSDKLLNDFFVDIEKHICEAIAEISPKWFNGKKFEVKDIKERFISSSKDNLIKAVSSKITSVFDSQGEERTMADVEKKNAGMAIIHLKSIWITREELGLSIELVQLKYFSSKLSKITKCLIEESDSEGEEEESKKKVQKEDVPLSEYFSKKEEIPEISTEIPEEKEETPEEKEIPEEKEEKEVSEETEIEVSENLSEEKNFFFF